MKYLRFLYRPKSIWLGYCRVLEPSCPMKAISKHYGMHEPVHPSLTQSLIRKCTQHVLIYHKPSDRFQNATTPLVTNYTSGKRILGEITEAYFKDATNCLSLFSTGLLLYLHHLQQYLGHIVVNKCI